MERVICPHCGAGNRHSQDMDTCWQCEKGLWEAVDRNTYALDTFHRLQAAVPLAAADQPEVEPPFWTLRLAVLTTILTLLIFVYVSLLYFQLGTFDMEDTTAVSAQPPIIR